MGNKLGNNIVLKRGVTNINENLSSIGSNSDLKFRTQFHLGNTDTSLLPYFLNFSNFHFTHKSGKTIKTSIIFQKCSLL